MANTNNQSFHLLCFALVLVIGHWASEAMSRPLDHESVSMRERHERWMAKYGRVYKDEAEKEKRFNIFKENVKRIEEFNRNAEGKHLYTLGVNALTDVTREEFRATYIGHKMNQSSSAWSRLSSSNKTKFSFVKLDDVPSSVNWQQMGAVTSVKDQGLCGCCWAFSTVAAIEGLNMIKNGQLISLSEQQLVDCFNGCNGKDIDLTFQYINEQTSGLATYDQYPYISQQGGIGQCQESTNPSVVAINGYIEVPPNDENALMQAVSQQPVAVTINADGFQSYSSTSGIFDGPCGSELNHAVTIVGYDTDPSGVEYWLIKNSWGEDWGENGFMRILRGQNVCSISSRASYPTM